jgi:hypothetical protein
LVLEKIIIDYIKIKNPDIGMIEKSVWQFSKKLEIAKGITNSLFNGPILGPIESINTIRNTLSHDISVVTIPEEKVKSIREFFRTWPETNSLPAIDLIYVFVTVVAAILAVHDSASQKMEKLQGEMRLIELDKLAILDEIFGAVQPKV